MEKMNCDIIRDLIPVYVDGLSSEATKKCVEEHMENCGECRRMLAACKNRMLSGKNMEQKGLDGFKKIKGIINIQNFVLYLILAFMISLGAMLFVFHKTFATNPTYSALFAICAVVNVFAGINYKKKKGIGKTEYILGVVSVLADLYLMGMYFYLARQIRDKAEMVFGRELSQAGPFMEKQLMICFGIQIVFFIYNLLGIMRHDKDGNWQLCINMMGIFLTLVYGEWGYLMESYETVFYALVRGTVEIVIICILGVIASLVCTKALNRKFGESQGKKEEGL